MEIQGRQEWNRKYALLTIILSVLLAYGLLLLRFSLRNDQTSYYLPFRMYLRDAFVHHEFLLWNPFMSGSYPAHCDMQGSRWNPIVNLLALVFDYNATVLSVELLLYLLIGAVGCFYFALDLSRNLYACTVVAVIYACGGFTTSLLQFMSWVGSFAFLPWAVHAFYLLLKKPTIYSGIGLAISLWLLLVCGYPSFLIYLGYGLIFITLAYCCRLWSQKEKGRVGAIIGYGLLAVVFLLLLGLPAIHSFYEYLPYYARAKSAAEWEFNFEHFSWNWVMGLLLPVSGTLTWASEFYIGLVPLLILFTAGWGKWRLRFPDRVLLPGFLFTLFFVQGSSTPVRMLSARYLPLMNAFGWSHSMGVFLVLPLFAWLLPKLELLFCGKLEGQPVVLRRGAFLAGVVILVWLMAGYGGRVFWAGIVKDFYYVSAVWQLLVLGLLYFSRRILTTPRSWLFFILTDLVVSAATLVPLTGLTLTSPKVYDRSAADFYRSDARDYLESPTAKMAALRDFDKRKQLNAFKITGRRDFPSYTRSDTFFRYVADDERYKRLFSLPFVFSDSGTPLQVHAIRLGYNFIDVDVRTGVACRMVLQQTYYPRWRATDPAFTPSAYAGVFLQVALRKGENQVRLVYYKKDLYFEAGISVITLILSLGILLSRYRKRRRVVLDAV
jgi:hypothetical protein